jgi:hypothetical protein
MAFKHLLPAIALGVASFATPAMAAEPIYAPVGTPNAAVYSFFADADGDLGAYYLGGFTRSFTSRLLVFVNGSQLGAPAFNTQTAIPGSFVNFGSVSAGDEIEFVLQILAPGSVAGQEIWSTIGSSTPPSEDDGLQQIFSADWGGGSFSYQNGFGPTLAGSIAAGDYTFVAFEDILGEKGPRLTNDFDYNDHRFAFTNVSNVIPEPATWAMLITGFGLVGFALRRRKASIASVAA